MTQYASTFDLDSTGDFRLSGSAFAEGQPAVQIVLATLATQRGSNLADPEDGLDYTIADKAVPNIARLWQSEVERALSRHVRNGVIRNLRVTVDAGGAPLKYEVEFTDPRDTSSPQKISRSIT